MSQELMPCPWCPSGGRPRVVDDAGYTTDVEWTVTCEECGAQSAFRTTQESAAEAWNTRPTAQAVAVDDAMVITACSNYNDWVGRSDQRKLANPKAMRIALQAALEGR